MGEKNRMHRRCFHHDYRGRRIYMLTMTVEGRSPLLGTLTSGEGGAAVQLSPLGQAVERAWLNLPSYYPQLKMLAHQVMPDHLHGIVFVERELPRHLGQVVAGFKYGTTRLMRDLLATPSTGTAEPCHTQLEGQTEVPAAGAALAVAALAGGQCGVVCGSVSPSQPVRLWSEGYHDMIV